jgi:acyl-CoA thioesterase I
VRWSVGDGIRVMALAVLATAWGCGGAPDRRSETAPPSAPAVVPPEPPASERPVVLILGTSLTAGFGLPDADLAYPALLQQKADSAGYRVQIVNAGVSGETSAGALRRLDWVLQRPVSVFVLETGANDGLRGQEPDSLRANIEAILDRVRRQQPPPRILLVGMEALPNLGQDYLRRFRSVYPAVAKKYGVPLVPFLLQGVAGVDSLNQADGVHPTPAGQRRIADTMWRYLEPMLREVATPAT